MLVFGSVYFLGWKEEHYFGCVDFAAAGILHCKLSLLKLNFGGVIFHSYGFCVSNLDSGVRITAFKAAFETCQWYCELRIAPMSVWKVGSHMWLALGRDRSSAIPWLPMPFERAPLDPELEHLVRTLFLKNFPAQWQSFLACWATHHINPLDRLRASRPSSTCRVAMKTFPIAAHKSGGWLDFEVVNTFLQKSNSPLLGFFVAEICQRTKDFHLTSVNEQTVQQQVVKFNYKSQVLLWADLATMQTSYEPYYCQIWSPRVTWLLRMPSKGY